MSDPTRIGSSAWSGAHNPLGLTELEVASGVVLDPTLRNPHISDATESPLEVLAKLCQELLSKAPCVVAFSGGRDSSALLATLTVEARRHGLQEPVAITSRWTDDPASREDEWQQHVIDEIQLKDWEIINPGDDLDLLGPVATSALSRIGLMWPAPSYALLPLMERARGGVLVTGEGGDEVFGLWPYSAPWEMLSGKRSFNLRAIGALGIGLGPKFVREKYWSKKHAPYQKWLRPGAMEIQAQRMAADSAVESAYWARYLRGVLTHRSAQAGNATSSRLASSVGASFSAPFLDSRFISALGRIAPVLGMGNRSSIMTRVFGEILDPPILTRVTKATFGGVFWGRASRDFAAQWDGTGVDSELVDEDMLRSAWLSDLPLYGAALPLHAAWLSNHVQKPSSNDP